MLDQPWIHVLRLIDHGYRPDPTVCLWVALLPNRRAIAFKERVYTGVLAADCRELLQNFFREQRQRT